MKMFVGLVRNTALQFTIHILIKINKSFDDINVIMEVFRMKMQNLLSVCAVIASRFRTVEVLLGKVFTGYIRTRRFFIKHIEAILH